MRVGGAIRLIKERYATDADLSQFASEIGESLEFVKEFLANKTKVTPQFLKRLGNIFGTKIEPDTKRVGGAIRLIKERYATDADLSQFASEIGESLEFVKEFLANKTKVTPQLAKRIAIALGIKIEDSEMTTNFRDFEEERQKRVQEEIDAFFLDNSYSDHNYILDENDNIIGETSKLQRKQSELSRLCQNFVQDPIATKELSVQMLDNKDIKKIRQGEKYLFKSTKCKLSNSYEVTKKGIIKLYKDLWEAIHGKNKQQEKQEHLF